MNILHIVGSMNRAGAETFLMNIFRKIDRKNFKFYFLCYTKEKFDYEEEIEQLGGKIIRIHLNNINIIKNIKEIAKIIKEYNIDIVHSHTYYNSIFSVIATKLCNKKIIVHSHNTKSLNSPNILQMIYYFISKLIINIFSDICLACSEAAAKAMFYKKTKYFIIKNGIEIEKFSFNEFKRKAFRENLNINSDTKVLCTIARFEEQKNHKFLIEVFKEYNKINRNSILILVGRGSLEESIKEKVKKMKLEKNVFFLGVRNDVDCIYSASDIFILPSIFEGLGIVLIEAQANGLKCIVSNNIPKEVDITNEVIFLDIHQGAKKWAKTIENLNITRYEKYNQILQKGYDIKTSVKKLEKIYSLLEKKYEKN